MTERARAKAFKKRKVQGGDKMNPRKVLSEFVVLKCTGKGFLVKKGQVLRIIAHEGPQVADIIFLNARNYKEQFSARWSVLLNALEGIGGFKRITKLYSKVPWERVMLTVIDDKVGEHVFGAHCSERYMELTNRRGQRSCSDNFQDALADFGIQLEDLDSCGVFNVFMSEAIDEDGTVRIVPPIAKKGDYIDFLAEMNVLVGFSNCPDDSETNNFEPKDMKVQILENA